eukprot:gene21345-27375_t
MKPPTRLPSQGNSSAASRMSALGAKSTPTITSSEQQQQHVVNVVDTFKSASINPLTTNNEASVDVNVNAYVVQTPQDQPRAEDQHSDMEEELHSLFHYGPDGAASVGGLDEESDQMFDNSVRNLERIMMHPDESDEDHQRRHAMEMLADQQQQQQSFAASSPTASGGSAAGTAERKMEAISAQSSTTPLSLSSLLGTGAISSGKGSLQGVSSLLNTTGLTGLNGPLPAGQIGSMRPMILDGFGSMSDHLLSGGPSPMQRGGGVHGLQPFGSFGGGGLSSINGNNMSNHILTMNNMSGAGLGGTLGGSLSAGGIHAHSSGSSSGLGSEYRVGAYTREERQMKIEAFRAKKRKRIWRKQIKYDCRKRLADTRPRVKGRFVSRKLGEGDDMMMGGGMMGEDGDFLMGDGSGGGGGMMNRHMMLDPHTGLLMGGMGMNNMMFMNSLAGASGGGLTGLNNLGAAGMYGGMLPGQQQIPYGGGMNFGASLLGGMDGSMGGFPPQRPTRVKKNRNNHNNQNMGMTSSGANNGGGGLSNKDLMNFQIQQRYANAVYNNGGVGGGGDLMFNPQAGLGGANGLDFLNNNMLANVNNQMFMPPLDFTSGAGGLLNIKSELGAGGGGVGSNMFNDQKEEEQRAAAEEEEEEGDDEEEDDDEDDRDDE